MEHSILSKDETTTVHIMSISQVSAVQIACAL